MLSQILMYVNLIFKNYNTILKYFVYDYQLMAITWNNLPNGKQFGGFSSDSGFENNAPNGSKRLDFRNLPDGCDEYAIGAYIKIKGNTPADEEIGFKLGGGRHTGDAEEESAKKGRCYVVGIRADGSRVRIRKEFPHPKHHGTGIDDSLSNIGNLRNRWVGVLGVKMHEDHNGSPAVRIMAFLDTATQDPDNPQNNWQQILDVTDEGNWNIRLANNTPSFVTVPMIKEVWLTPFDSTSRSGTIRVDKQGDNDSDFFGHKHDFFRQIGNSDGNQQDQQKQS